MKKTTLFSLMLVAGMTMLPSFVRAQAKVTLTTSKEVGADFKIVTNPGKMTIDWGDGNAQEVTSTGEPILGTLKGQSVVLTSSNLTSLDCSSNELTAVEFAEVNEEEAKLPLLTSFSCHDNALTSLNINYCSGLTYLDCSNNQLKPVRLDFNTNLEFYDCSNNEFSSLSLGKVTKLKVLVCSGNNLRSLNVASLQNLETLWCQDNSISSLNVSTNRKLESLVCDNNELTLVSASGCTQLVDFWCDNNKLKSLNLSANTKLQTISCSNNQLTSLEMSAWNSANKGLAFYCDGNMLTFSSMHDRNYVSNTANAFFGPQNEFPLPESQIYVNNPITLDGFAKNADGTQTYAKYIWKNGDDALKAGSDYAARANTFSFKKPFESIQCEVTSSKYPDLVLVSTPLTVIDEGTGIDEIMDSFGFTYVTNNGSIMMTSEKPYPVRIYTLDGKVVWSGVVTSAKETVSLGHGLFLVNGMKITL